MAGVFTETAAKCCGTARSPSLPASQARAVRALVSVSSVVKVLEETMNSVVTRIGGLQHLREVTAVDVGNELAARRPAGEGLQRLHRHGGP